MLLLRTHKSVQQLGLVFIAYWLQREPDAPFQFDQGRAIPKQAAAMPLRVAAFHMCHNNKWLAPVLAFVKFSFNLVTRVRIRTHFGKCEVNASPVLLFPSIKHQFLTYTAI